MALSLLLMLIFGEGTLKNLFQRARPYTHLPNLQQCAVCADLAFSAGMRTPAGFRQRNLCLLKQSGKQGLRIQRVPA